MLLKREEFDSIVSLCFVFVSSYQNLCSLVEKRQDMRKSENFSFSIKDQNFSIQIPKWEKQIFWMFIVAKSLSASGSSQRVKGNISHHKHTFQILPYTNVCAQKLADAERKGKILLLFMKAQSPSHSFFGACSPHIHMPTETLPFLHFS